MKKTRIKDLPFNDTIATVTKKGQKRIQFKTIHGEFSISNNNRFWELKKGDKLRIVKCLRKDDWINENKIIVNVKSSAFSIFEWRIDGTYKQAKEYITIDNAINNQL